MGLVETASVGMSANPSLADRRILVTGATGMVGSALVSDLVASGAYVAVLVLDADPQTELYRSGDIERVAVVSGALEDIGTLERALRLHETDTIFHLGAQTIVGAAHHAPLYTFEANIRGTYNLLEACRRHPDLVTCVVVASSDKAYGEQELPYVETAPLLGRHPYEVSKSCADMLAQCYHHTYGLPVTIARCGNIYGGGDRNWSRIIPGTIRDFLHGRRPIIRSDGKFLRDYMYVKDAVAAYKALADALLRHHDNVAGEAFNFSDEAPATVLDIVAMLQQLMGCQHLEPDIRNQAKGEIPHQAVSAAKARTVLGWRHQYTREEGLLETIEWYRSYFGVAALAAIGGVQ
jgi:CDP-glucose 4,6-dehydratase